MVLDDHDRQLLADIQRVGWHIVGVPADSEGPSFAFSVGMQTTFEHPEIILFGLAHSLMFDVTNLMGDEIRGGRRFEEPQLYEGLVERFACKTAPVSPHYHREYLGYALWYRKYLGLPGTSLRAIQLLWPDRQGYFPDQSACHR